MGVLPALRIGLEPVSNTGIETTGRVIDPIVILGGGLAGLSAAFHLSGPSVVLEREAQPGGLLATLHYDGFTFDAAPHIFFTDDADARRLFVELQGEANVIFQPSDARVFSHGVLTRFPFQASLYGLPTDVITDCLVGLAEIARTTPAGAPASFREWALAALGEGIARHFLFPYNRKLWGLDADEMTADWVAGKVIVPDFRDAVEGALCDRSYNQLPNREFGYPRQGGIAAFASAISRCVPDLRLGNGIAVVDPSARLIRLVDGEVLSYRAGIWTLPLVRLPDLVPDAPRAVVEATRRLQYRKVVAVHLGVSRPDLACWHWMYFSEPRHPFYRVSFPGNMAASMVPDGCSSLIAEIAMPPDAEFRPETLIDETVEGLVAAGLLHPGEQIEPRTHVVLDPAYVVYDHARSDAVRICHDYLLAHDLIPAGRFGEWAFLNMDRTLLSGRRAAREIERRLQT